eukprot:TRINITY_DN56979_c0_g1_i1.p1 TRINITY_DN56979_c0_g1~~TRINITY_DN56979_c0_g1_i1.p1  ORF type:complete len:669 (+),score=132.05 TRINITY_DN56979_c0_g1_i1:151-2157(+)
MRRNSLAYRRYHRTPAQNALADFVLEKEHSMLRVWRQELDPDHHHRVTEFQFVRYLREAKYPDDPLKLFQEIDDDGNGEIYFYEIDPDACSLWAKFRKWCCQEFPSGAQAMLAGLAEIEGSKESELRIHERRITQTQFCDSLIRAGWEHGCEEELFLSLSSDCRWLILADLRWFDTEIARYQRRMKAKGRAKEEQKLHAKKQKIHGGEVMAEFKYFLKQKYGSLIRAWRTLLVPSDEMMCHRTQFLRACGDLGWKTGVKTMWDQLDKDGSGVAGIAEFDFQLAEALALFADFATKRFSSMRDCFQALDGNGNAFITEKEFLQNCRKLAFNHATPSLFNALDKDGKRRIVLSDLQFLSSWKVPGFLLATPNLVALVSLKAAMKKKYGTYLRAWQTSFDKDGSNKCIWDEFKYGCKKMSWEGDIAGAWRAFDFHSRGYISLQDVDPDVCRLMMHFRAWARENFGSVKSMFHVFDVDGSRTLSMKEFNKSCTMYDFHGDPKTVFRALDSADCGDLSLDDFLFLDQYWASENGMEEDDTAEKDTSEDSPQMRRQGAPSVDVADSYGTEEWPDGELHPAFRSWANSRRRRPVTKIDGSVPELAAQLDLGSPRAFKRPMLLLAYVPQLPSQPPSRSARENRRPQQNKLPQVGAYSERGTRKPAEKAEDDNEMLE